ncbi:SIR2 family protein [Paraburkholderia aspalathi]|uniref:SIR2 family protein n=1 Tax=Paraburkholderia aspalathi TaxID=1324617 RepID=UPI0038B8F570
MLANDIDAFVNEYVKELHEETAAVFLGAGMSAPAGFVDWVKLLEPLAKQLGLDARTEADHLVELAQYHVNDNGQNRNGLSRRLIEEFPTHVNPPENHKLLARLPISTYWTTNYDRLIEKALEGAGKIVDVKFRVPQLANTKPRRDAIVYKMHGDVDHAHEAVLTKDDYERYSVDRGAFVNALTGELVSKTFLFLGFSFKDPNLDYILSRIRITFSQHGRQHYCIFKKVTKETEDSPAEFEYKQQKQRHLIEDLKRFNVRTLLVDDYPDITAILRRIDRAYRRKTIFISGSADELNGWDAQDVNEFLFSLGKIVIQKGYRLVSGFGWGISNELLSGAIEQIYAQRQGHIQDHLVVRPFPRAITDHGKRSALWHEYRTDLISQAGIALFLFGNKRVEDKIIPADGVEKEFRIAQSLDLVTLPVGATGYSAKSLAEEIGPGVESGPEKAEFKEAFRRLQESVAKPQELLDKISNAFDALGKH